MGQVISVVVEKGGSAKTTTVVNLAALMARDGNKVLVVDLDAQANATFSLTGQSKNSFDKRGVYEVVKTYGFVPTETFISKTIDSGIDIIPSNTLTSEIVEFLPLLQKEHNKPRYTFLLDRLAEISAKYDYVLIDTPPALGDLFLSALFASDYAIIPAKCEKYSLDAIISTFIAINTLEKETGDTVKILGILLTMVERTSLSKVIRNAIANSEYGKDLFSTEIRKSQAVNDSTVAALPVVNFDKNCNASKDYISLWTEIKERVG